MTLETIVKSTGEDPRYVVIWLHGLGADGHDFEPVVPEFKIPELPIKFVFPHAPKIPVTINGGMVMRAWYDIKSMDISQRADMEGVMNSEKLIHELIEDQVNQGFKHEQILLAGFSQGGAMTLHTGLLYSEKLAGLIALSCYIPSTDVLSSAEKTQDLETPIFLGHGIYDSVVPNQLGQQAEQYLSAKGYQVEMHNYPIQHGVSMEEISDIKKWLVTHFLK